MTVTVDGGPTTTFTEQTPVYLFPAGTVTATSGDGNSIDILRITLGTHSTLATTTLSLDAAATALAANIGVTVSYSSGTGVLTLTGSNKATADWQSLLRGIIYNDTSDTPDTSVSVTLFVDNTASGGDSDTDSHNLTITAVNDAPVATITPTSYSATEQTSLNLKNTGMTVSDVDAGTDDVTVILSVTEGTLTVDRGGVTGATVTGSGTSSVTIVGTLTEINAILNTNGTSVVSYTNGSNAPSASATLTLSVNDGGNNGTGGSLIGSDTATINLTAVNDAPTANITPTSYSATEGISLTLNGTGLSIADVDAGSGTVTVTLSVTQGTLNVRAGTTGALVSNSDTSSVTVTGTVSQINSLLAGSSGSTVVYNASDAPAASATLTLHVSDDGNTGGGALTANDTATINITATNDAPVATITSTDYAATEQTGLNLHGTGLSISDADAASGTMTLTLSVTSGTLDVANGTTGANVSNSGTSSVTITGTVTQINNLLTGNSGATVAYINNSDTPAASATLTLQVSDGGNTGTGGTLNGSDTATCPSSEHSAQLAS